MRFFILFLCFSLVFSYDFLEEAKKYIDHDVDPCENFYRHACRLGGPHYLPVKLMKDRVIELAKSSNYKLESSSIELFNELPKNGEKFLSNIPLLAAEVYKSSCDAGKNKSEVLQAIQGSVPCIGPFCMTHLSKDPDCDRITKHLLAVFEKFVYNKLPFVERLSLGFTGLVKIYDGISLYMNDNEESRVYEMQIMFEEMKNIAIGLISKTPWAANHNVTEVITTVIEELRLGSLIREVENEVGTIVQNINKKYLDCKESFAKFTDLPVTDLCVLNALIELTTDPDSAKLNLEEIDRFLINAYTVFPEIKLGFMWYFIYFNSKSALSELGAPGFTLAHELSHAIIKSSEGDIIPYFSEEAKTCVQNQYKATCKEFDEGGCVINSKQFDENGADVLAMEIVNVIYERHFMNRARRTTEEANNFQDLQEMFYSISAALCFGSKSEHTSDDPHAPHNVRINVLVNHPTFQKAFQCPDDSRMMRSRTKQCFVYGKNAPHNRHRFE